MAKRKIGLFGGSFDPVHNAHIKVARSALEHFSLQKVIFIPAGQPPHKTERKLTPGPHRLKMLRLAFPESKSFDFSDYELQKTTPSYSMETIHYFQVFYPDAVLYFLIGEDSLADLPKWHKVKKLVNSCVIAAYSRPGVNNYEKNLRDFFGEKKTEEFKQNWIPGEPVEVSSTEIRKRVREGKSISGLVPEKVAEYIQNNNLYR